jgi:hypothetical protein
VSIYKAGSGTYLCKNKVFFLSSNQNNKKILVKLNLFFFFTFYLDRKKSVKQAKAE